MFDFSFFGQALLMNFKANIQTLPEIKKMGNAENGNVEKQKGYAEQTTTRKQRYIYIYVYIYIFMYIRICEKIITNI